MLADSFHFKKIMLSDQSFLDLWYEPWALLRDQERSAMLPNLAAGKGIFKVLVFNILEGVSIHKSLTRSQK